MKKLWIISFAVLITSIMATPVLEAKESQPSNVVTHQELGQILVNLLGLSKTLPASPSDQQVFASLLMNGIGPEGGWEVDQKVTRADLARVMVQALGLQHRVTKPSEPRSWMMVLKAEAIAIDSVGQAAGSLDPLMNPLGKTPAFDATTYPLQKATDAGTPLPDDPFLGADMS